LDILKTGYDDLYLDAKSIYRHEHLIDSFFAKLRDMGKRKRRPPLALLVAIIGAVYTLERYGYLRPDKYNGMKLEYVYVN